MLVDRPGAEPGLAACKAAVLPLSLSAQKREAAAKQTTKKQTNKTQQSLNIITLQSKYNMYMKLPLQDRQFIEHHLALAEVT